MLWYDINLFFQTAPHGSAAAHGGSWVGSDILPKMCPDLVLCLTALLQVVSAVT